MCIRWALNGRVISSDGTVFTKGGNEVAMFELQDEQQVNNAVFSELEFTYSLLTEGYVECVAAYDTGYSLSPH